MENYPSRVVIIAITVHADPPKEIHKDLIEWVVPIQLIFNSPPAFVLNDHLMRYQWLKHKISRSTTLYFALLR